MRPRLLLAGLLLLPILYLFTPKTFDTPCLTTVRVWSAMSFVHNCDTLSVATNARDLGKYLFQDNPWRSRPVYIFIFSAAFLTAAVSPVASIVRATFLTDHVAGDARALRSFVGSFDTYVALTIIKFVVIGLTVYLVGRLLGGVDRPISLGLAAVIISSDLVQGWVWSQHSMNVIVPIGTVYAFVAGVRLKVSSWRSALCFGLATASAILTYGYAMIWISATVAGWLFQGAREHRLFRSARELGAVGVFLAASCLPVAGWAALNVFWLKLPVAYEARSVNEFSWLAQVWQQDGLIEALAAKLEELGRVLEVAPGILVLAPLAATLLLCALKPADLSFRRLIVDPIVVGVGVTCLSMLVFNYLQGYYQPRLTYGLLLALFLGLARIAQLTDRERLGTALLGLVAGFQLIQGFRAPPLTLT